MSGPGAIAEGNLKQENDSLKMEVKELEKKLIGLNNALEKSTEEIKNLERLCTELKNQNKCITELDATQLQNAEKQGRELALEVTASLEVMKNVNSSIDRITEDSKQAFAENEGLTEQLEKMKKEHDEIEEEMKKMLLEQCDEVVKLRSEVAQARLQNANDKERLYTEMQQLATSLLQSREQVKETKETELKLRQLLQNYDQKFEGLQKSLKETNTAYDGFKGEMAKVCGRTKELESETVEWKSKWAQSNTSLQAANEEHSRIQTGIAKSHEGLAKMTNLCRALQDERKQLLDALKRVGAGGE